MNNDPIVEMGSKDIKNDMLMFKEDTLKDLKEAKKNMSEKYKNLNFKIKEKFESFELRIKNYESKIMELSNLINTDTTIKKRVDSLMEFKEKADDSMLTEKIRLDHLSNDLNKNIERINEILRNTVIYPGKIGGISRFQTFHELIDYILEQCSLNKDFREKSNLDFRNFKTKLDNSINSFNTQINSLLNTTSEYTRTCVKGCEDRMKNMYNVYEDRLQDARIENANYAIGLERATDVLKKELENLHIIKKELYDKVDKGILEIKNDNIRVIKLFSGYKKNFNVIQRKFTQLSEFIRDVRFRTNIKDEINRKDFNQFSDLINFDKKTKTGFYDGVYDNMNNIKKGLESQLKNYIEGKISAEQLFKKSETNKSASVKKSKTFSTEGNRAKRKSLAVVNNNVSEFGEEVKLSFIELLKNKFKKRMSFEEPNPNNIIDYKKEVIKEEEEDDNNSSKESNSLIAKKTYKQNYIKKNNSKDLEKNKEDKKDDTNKILENKKNIIKQRIEDTKIQIISKSKDSEEEKEKNSENILKDKVVRRSSIKNVINDLLSVKDLMQNIKNNPNENLDNKSEKNKINTNPNNTVNNAINDNKNNKTINLYNNIKNDASKINNKEIDKKPIVINIKKNKINEQNNIGIITEYNNINDQKTRNKNSVFSNRNIGTQEHKSVNVKVYNATINSLSQNSYTINKVNVIKKPKSSNKKINKFILKQKIFNLSNKSSSRGFEGIRRNERRTVESMYNLLNINSK